MSVSNDITIGQWLDQLLARGVYGFSKDFLHQEFPGLSGIAIKRALNRLSRKGRIVSQFKGYYLILPPQYASKGMLPPPLYLDAFMKSINRQYYISLLNAAVFHGASHQQPQEYFVMTGFPVLRPTQVKGVKINYISIKNIPESLIEKQKTDAGYLRVSNPPLTACDLMQYEKRIGGINRVTTVLNEMADTIDPDGFTPVLLQHSHVTTLQRLGYVLEAACFRRGLANALYHAMEKEKLNFFRIPLKPGSESRGYSSDNRWKVIVNAEIETDE